MSYLYIKQFIDEQVKILSRPFVIDDDLRAVMAKHNISEETMKNIVFKANLRLKRQIRAKFSRQVVHQIVQQVAKNETDKLLKVNTALTKISLMVQPVLLPDFSKVGNLNDRIRMVNELVNELPDPQYLFAVQELAEKNDVDKTDLDKDLDPTRSLEQDPEAGMLVQDDEERVEVQLRKELEQQYTRVVDEEIRKATDLKAGENAQLKERYTQLRTELLALNDNLIYKLEKLAYLRKLNQKLDFVEASSTRDLADSEDEESEVEASSADLGVQINRFKILVEKLEFAMR